MTRISNQLLTNNFMADLRSVQLALARLQHQSSTGKAFDRPVDNPSGAAVSLDLHSALKFLTQYSRNVDDGNSRLNYMETTVSEVDTQLQRVRELSVQGANTYLTRSDRNAIAEEMNQLLEHVITLSNSNFRGRYIYSGYESLSRSFDVNSNTEDGFTNSITYRGDYGNIGRNIGINSDLDVNFTGKEVFVDQTYELTGKQLSGATLGYSGVFELNNQLFVVTPTMALSDVRDLINANTGTEVYASIESGFRLNLTSMNSSKAIQVKDISGKVLQNMGVLPMGAYNLAQAAPAALPLIDSRGALHTAAAFAPLTLTTGNQDLVVTLAGAANNGFTQSEVLKLDAITYNTIGDLVAEVQKKADLAFGADKIKVQDNGLGQIEIETAVQSSAVAVTDIRIGGTATNGSVDTASFVLGFNAVPGIAENADAAGFDGNDRFTIDLGLNAYIVDDSETPLDLPAIEINLDGGPAGPATLAGIIDNMNAKILANKYLSGLVEAVDDNGRIRLQTAKQDGSVKAADLLLANAVTGAPVPATDTLGNLGFYRDPLTGISAPPVPAAVFGTLAGPFAVTAGVDDQFSIDLGPNSSIDGTDPPPVTLTLTAGAYPTAAALANEINAQISRSAVLQNAVLAVVDGVTGNVNLVTTGVGSQMQAGDLALADVTAGALANLGLGAAATPGGGSADGQGIIQLPHNMIDTMIQIRDELLGYAAPKSRLTALQDADGAGLGLVPGSKIRISSDGTSMDFTVQRFTTMQDLADMVERKLGFQVNVEVLRDGKLQIFNPTTSVVNDISIEAFDLQNNHITAFEKQMESISGKLIYRGVLQSATVYEDERFQHLTDRIGDVDDGLETVLSTLAQIGSRTKRMEMTLTQNDQVEVTLQELQTKNDYVDMADVLTQLTQQENVLRAALSTGSRIITPSLFDFLR
jgi:flagellin-like hook-associated protein FlgL